MVNGAILIDNPGMREVGITDGAGALESVFDRIFELAAECGFSDCTHTSESGCAVLEALEHGEVDQAAYDNFLKMKREKAHFEATVAERREKERRFGKMVKGVVKHKNQNRL
jgi:ribosome biogenesis GTPase / thiamine phosphate phosphatase